MKILDTVRQELHRRASAVLLPLPPPAPPEFGWLRRSGHQRKARLATAFIASPGVILLAGVAVSAMYGSADPPDWMSSTIGAAALSAMVLAGVGLLLRSTVRCRVCGLRLGSSSYARPLGSGRWRWIASLDACPLCGDDGSASAESRGRWLQSGLRPEPAYWSMRRVSLTLLLVGLIGVGFALVVGLLLRKTLGH